MTLNGPSEDVVEASTCLSLQSGGGSWQPVWFGSHNHLDGLESRERRLDHQRRIGNIEERSKDLLQGNIAFKVLQNDEEPVKETKNEQTVR